jgi:hypothetical protein
MLLIMDATGLPTQRLRDNCEQSTLKKVAEMEETVKYRWLLHLGLTVGSCRWLYRYRCPRLFLFVSEIPPCPRTVLFIPIHLFVPNAQHQSARHRGTAEAQAARFQATSA